MTMMIVTMIMIMMIVKMTIITICRTKVLDLRDAGWVDTIAKHHTKIFIGSDNVAQYFPVRAATTDEAPRRDNKGSSRWDTIAAHTSLS